MRTSCVLQGVVLTLGVALWSTGALAAVIFSDSFDDGIVSPEIGAIGGASVFESGGELFAVMSTPGDGVSFEIPSNDINCYEISISTLSPFSSISIGNHLTWRWIVVDEVSLVEYTILESEWEQTGSRTFTTFKRKANGEVVKVQQEVEEEDLDVLPPEGQLAKLRWDRRTRNGAVEVQLEIVFVDATTGNVTKFVKLFDWQDPPGFISTRIEFESNFPLEMSFDSVSGADGHLESVPAFSPGAVWLLIVVLLFVAGALFRRARPRAV